MPRLIASYMKPDLHDHAVLHVSEGGREVASVELRSRWPDSADLERALRLLGFRPVDEWMHTPVCAAVYVEPIEA